MRWAGLPARYVVAFSGGADSTALLHALTKAIAEDNVTCVAVYVNHGLQDAANEWQMHCQNVAASLGADFHVLHAPVDKQSGFGLEAAARDARYAAFREYLLADDWLLTAHHQDDQAESVLLNLLRGSGVDGLAGIGASQRFAKGWLMRPLLDLSRSELMSYIDGEQIAYVDDPTNTALRFDRNYLRHAILPLIYQRWPAANKRLARSSVLASEARELLGELADLDLLQLGDGSSIDTVGLRQLSEPRQRNVLRRAIYLGGLPAAPSTRLSQILQELVPARQDAEPLVRWRGAEVRRYRERIYLLSSASREMPSAAMTLRRDSGDLSLGNLGRIACAKHASGGVRNALLQSGLEVRFRCGGESIQPHGHTHTFKLKKLLQQEAVVPWMRDEIPLLYAGQDLVAVADLFIAADAYEADGLAIVWSGHPSLY